MLKEASTGMHRGLRLTFNVINMSKRLIKEPKLSQRHVLNPISYLLPFPMA